MIKMIPVTYLIYIIFWGTLTIGGSGYIVFFKNQSAWWILLGVALCNCNFNPKQWMRLFVDSTKTWEEKK
jgi:hypothetical protein